MPVGWGFGVVLFSNTEYVLSCRQRCLSKFLCSTEPLNMPSGVHSMEPLGPPGCFWLMGNSNKKADRDPREGARRTPWEGPGHGRQRTIWREMRAVFLHCQPRFWEAQATHGGLFPGLTKCPSTWYGRFGELDVSLTPHQAGRQTL